MGSGESSLHYPFSMNVDDVGVITRPVEQPLRPFSSIASLQAASVAIRDESRLEGLDNTERSNLSAMLSLLTSRSTDEGSFSSRSYHPLGQGISPLLLSSDVGLGGMLEVLFGHRHRGDNSVAQDPVLEFPHNIGSPGRSTIRPRVLDAAMLTEETLSVNQIESNLTHRQSNNNRKKSNQLISPSINISRTHSIEEFKCPICLDVFDRPIVTPCRHVFCVECMITSLIRQSICPLCRSTVYVHYLRPLSQVVNDPALKLIYKRYQNLTVECPKCLWLGTMASWDNHVDSIDCRTRRETKRRQRTAREISSARSIQKESLYESETMVKHSLHCPIRDDAKNLEVANDRVIHDKRNKRRNCEGNQGKGGNFVQEKGRLRPFVKIARRHRKNVPNESESLDGESIDVIGQLKHPSDYLSRIHTDQHPFDISTSTSSTRPSTSEETETINTKNRHHCVSHSQSLEAPSPYHVDFEQKTLGQSSIEDSINSVNIPNSITSSEIVTDFSTDRLACWLIDHNPGVVIRLYVISHRMENTMGALGGLLFNGVTHTQAILEFESNQSWNRRCRRTESFSVSPLASLIGIKETSIKEKNDETSIKETDDSLQPKIFISMEIFGDRLGTEWQIHERFPPFKSTAYKIALYDDLGISDSTVVEFLLLSRHRQYSLLSWNCQIFISDFRKFANISDPPSSVAIIPRPISHSEELMQLLERIITDGNCPILTSCQLDPDSSYQQQLTSPIESPVVTYDNPSPPKSWVSNLNIFKMISHSNSNMSLPITPEIESTKSVRDSTIRHRKLRSPSTQLSPSLSSNIEVQKFPSKNFVSPTSPIVRVRSVTMCLFPAEDRHRMSLRPAAHFSAFLSRTFGLIRPTTPPEPLAFGRAAIRRLSHELHLPGRNGRLDFRRTQPPNSNQHSIISFPSQRPADIAMNSADPSITPDGSATPVSDSQFKAEVHRDNDYDLLQDTQTQTLNDAQIRLRYFTLPVLIFHIQALRIPSSENSIIDDCRSSLPLTKTNKTDSDSNQKWETLGFLSLEFRSDCGLWWHLYHEYPPGLLQASEQGGTDVIVSAHTSFPLEALHECLIEIKDKEYHATRWSAWEFTETILQRCCPSVAHHFLVLPVAEAIHTQHNLS